jgi:hypothetical protein
MTLDDEQVIIDLDALRGHTAYVRHSEARDGSDRVSLVIVVPAATFNLSMEPMKARELGMALIAFADAAEARA